MEIYHGMKLKGKCDHKIQKFAMILQWICSECNENFIGNNLIKMYKPLLLLNWCPVGNRWEILRDSLITMSFVWMFWRSSPSFSHSLSYNFDFSQHFSTSSNETNSNFESKPNV